MIVYFLLSRTCSLQYVFSVFHDSRRGRIAATQHVKEVHAGSIRYQLYEAEGFPGSSIFWWFQGQPIPHTTPEISNS